LTSIILEDLGKGLAHMFAKSIEPHIAADARRKTRSIGLTERSYEGVAALLANLAVQVPATVIEARLTVFRH
jgi:hypothetical protein